jgi:hypothetical protein
MDIHANIRRNIETHGRCVLSVGCGPDTPPFSYTIGNWIKRLPELLVFRLAPVDALSVLNDLSQQMIGRDTTFNDGDVVSLGGAFPVKIVDANDEARTDYTLGANRFYGHQDYQVLQVLVPDKEGRFPDDPLCAPAYSRLPVLTRTLN